MNHIDAETAFGHVGQCFYDSLVGDDYFCSSKKVAKVINNTLGLQKVKKSSISVSVASGLAAVVLKPV